MQYQTCECGERIPPTELPTKLLSHWNHQQSCLYSHIGCVSKTNFDSHYVQHGRIRVSVDGLFPIYEYTILLYWKIQVSEKPYSRKLYALNVLFKSARLAALGVNFHVKKYLFLWKRPVSVVKFAPKTVVLKSHFGTNNLFNQNVQ